MALLVVAEQRRDTRCIAAGDMASATPRTDSRDLSELSVVIVMLSHLASFDRFGSAERRAKARQSARLGARRNHT
jgi:hypothetical protein